MALEVYSKQQGTNMISENNAENDPKVCWWNCYFIAVIGAPHANLPLLKCLFFSIPVEKFIERKIITYSQLNSVMYR